METVTGLVELRDQLQGWRRRGEAIGFVPTMGNLHEGHLQLVRRARSLADRVVVSIFVNPMQFGPGEDFETYPRTLDADRAQLERERADLLFAPAVDLIYPSGLSETTRVEVPGVVRLEGTNVDRGKQLLQESGLALIAADDLNDAAHKVVAAAAA